MQWLIARLKERSTWIGIVWLATAFGLKLQPEAWEYVITLGMALAGLIGFVTSDTPREPQAPLPPIELIGKADEASAGPTDSAGHHGAVGNTAGDRYPTNNGMRVPSRPGLDTRPGVGWGDRD